MNRIESTGGFSSPGTVAMFVFCLMFSLVLGMVYSDQARAESLVVTSNADDGGGDSLTLREAVTQANANSEADTITFELPEGSRIITLTQGQLSATATQTTTIDGEDNEITIDANDQSRIFAVSNSGNLTLRSITLTNGNAPSDGGAILNTGTLTVTDSTISGNTAGRGGGGIFNRGTLTITDSTISGNSATNIGGGIHNGTPAYLPDDPTPPDQRTTITNSTISGNSADTRGSGVYNDNGYTEINYSTITNNTSTNASAEGVESFGDNSTGTRLTASIVAGNTSSGQPKDVGNFDGNRPCESGGGNVIGIVDAVRDAEFTAPGDTTGRTVSEAFGTATPTLEDNNGSTQTVALEPGSVAINRIPPGTQDVPEADQRGIERPQNSASDSGAYEFDGETDILVISPETLPDATEDEAYSQQLTASGSSGPYTFEVTEGELPDGLTLSDDGLISGTSTEEATSETFTVQAEDGSGFTGERDYTLTVIEVNDPPTFTLGDDQTVAEDAGPQSVTNFATDIDDGDPSEEQTVTFTVSNDNNPLFTEAGQPAISQSGTLTYTPAPNANGSATVTVVARDDGGTENGGDDTSEDETFTITVTAVNDAPVAQDDSYTTEEDTSLSVLPPGVLSNDTDTDNDEGDLTASLADDVQNGQLTLEADGSFTYTPDEGFNGQDTFTYIASDGEDESSESEEATVTIEVGAVNDSPTISQIDDRVIKENTATGQLRFTVSDPDDEASSLKVTPQSSNTALVKREGIRLSGTGEERTVRVVPQKNRTGSARITLSVEDPEGQKATESFVVRVSKEAQEPQEPDDKCTITGTSGSDLLRGTAGRDVICGLSGNDRLIGSGGDDIIRGGDGSDELEGGSGDDELYGGAGNDRLIGGPGRDKLDGGSGTNKLQQ